MFGVVWSTQLSRSGSENACFLLLKNKGTKRDVKQVKNSYVCSVV